MLKNILLVGLGGGIGSMLRYLIGLGCGLLHWASWISTLSVNALGSFLIGIFLSACGSGDWKLLLVVGLCGGFTTYSTFSAQSLDMLRSGNFLGASGYILGMLLLCLLCVWAGSCLGHRL